MKHNYNFRPIKKSDERFLSQLYASTREDELSILINWTDEQKREFLEQQFQAQHKFYQGEFKKAQFSLVMMDQHPIGRLYIDRRKDEIRLIDIALLPSYRGQGIGRQLMEEVLEEGRKANKPVRIHVEHNNPAMRLYNRLGFQKVGDTGVYFLMEWKPEEIKTSAD